MIASFPLTHKEDRPIIVNTLIGEMNNHQTNSATSVDLGVPLEIRWEHEAVHLVVDLSCCSCGRIALAMFAHRNEPVAYKRGQLQNEPLWANVKGASTKEGAETRSRLGGSDRLHSN